MSAIDILGIVAAAGVTAYSLLIFFCRVKWTKLPLPGNPENQTGPLPKVTIIIVARNESRSIVALLGDIVDQSYPQYLIEIILIDDQSDDNTIAVARAFAGNNKITLKAYPIELDSFKGGSRKKVAIMQAAKLSAGDILLLTDADCRVPPDWVASHVGYYTTFADAKLVFGAFQFEGDGPFVALLNLEAMSLTGVAAATNLMTKPTMCSGANISYKRDLVHQLRPFDNNYHIASGDDEFMLHAVQRQYPGAAYYNKAPGSMVTTCPPPSIAALYHQRRRWAGKWKAYHSGWPKALALMVIAGNIGFLLLGVASVVSSSGLWLVPIACKWLAEFTLVASVSSHFSQNGHKRYFLPMEIIYPFYAIFFGIASNFGKYRWKGRVYQ